MKKIVYALMVSTPLLVQAVQDNQKPVRVGKVTAATKTLYNVIKTTIYKAPSSTTASTDADAATSSKTVVTRTLLGTVGGTKKDLIVNAELKLPQIDENLINTGGVLPLIGKVGEVVSAVKLEDPRAQMGTKLGGAALSTLSGLADKFVDIASDDLAKKYGLQSYTLTVLELVPVGNYTAKTSTLNQFYTVGTQNISVLPYLFTALDDINLFQLGYNKAFDRFVQEKTNYELLVNLRNQIDQNEDPDAYSRASDKAIRYYIDKLYPAIVAKNDIEEHQFVNLPNPKRIAIMPSYTESGAKCYAGDSERNTRALAIIYYMGAKQTNNISVEYCTPNQEQNSSFDVIIEQNDVKTPESGQEQVIEYQSNDLNLTYTKAADVQAVPGGVRFEATSNMLFNANKPEDPTLFDARKTPIFGWWLDGITDPNGGSYVSLMMPFDVLALKKEVAADKDAKNKAKNKEIMAQLDKVIESLSSSELKTPTTTSPAVDEETTVSNPLESASASNVISGKYPKAVLAALGVKKGQNVLEALGLEGDAYKCQVKSAIAQLREKFKNNESWNSIKELIVELETKAEGLPPKDDPENEPCPGEATQISQGGAQTPPQSTAKMTAAQERIATPLYNELAALIAQDLKKYEIALKAQQLTSKDKVLEPSFNKLFKLAQDAYSALEKPLKEKTSIAELDLGGTIGNLLVLDEEIKKAKPTKMSSADFDELQKNLLALVAKTKKSVETFNTARLQLKK